MTVSAGSPPSWSNAETSRHDSMTLDSGATGPCRISPTPCSIPAKATSSPSTATVILVALGGGSATVALSAVAPTPGPTELAAPFTSRISAPDHE